MGFEGGILSVVEGEGWWLKWNDAGSGEGMRGSCKIVRGMECKQSFVRRSICRDTEMFPAC